MGYFDVSGNIKAELLDEQAESQAKQFVEYFKRGDRVNLNKRKSLSSAQMRRFFSEFRQLEKKVKKADFYMIANFQDLQNTSYEPEKIQEMFGIKTYGFCAIKREAKDVIYEIFSEMIRVSIIEKIISKQT